MLLKHIILLNMHTIMKLINASYTLYALIMFICKRCLLQKFAIDCNQIVLQEFLGSKFEF